ncbi:energy-coupling factor ABC transporter substrate-binding protein, partial [Calderihabitans maritimus]
LAVIIAALPLMINPHAEYGGADSQAEGIIMELSPGLNPWFEPLWEPPSGEIESLLFALQAAIGAGFVCFYLGYLVGKKKGMGAGEGNVQN